MKEKVILEPEIQKQALVDAKGEGITQTHFVGLRKDRQRRRTTFRVLLRILTTGQRHLRVSPSSGTIREVETSFSSRTTHKACPTACKRSWTKEIVFFPGSREGL